MIISSTAIDFVPVGGTEAVDDAEQRNKIPAKSVPDEEKEEQR